MPSNNSQSKKFNFDEESAALNRELQEVKVNRYLTKTGRKLNKFLSESEAEHIYKNLISGKINSNEAEDIIRDTRLAAINNKNKTLTNLEKKDLAKYLGHWNKSDLLILKSGLLEGDKQEKKKEKAVKRVMNSLNKLRGSAPGNTFKNKNKLYKKILANKNSNYLNTTRKKSGLFSKWLTALAPAF
uniref:Uncharacterized protein n=1 Tax=viral metagenome TaxID=1070528 RepID=A0A6C0BCL4_9ZZZZ